MGAWQLLKDNVRLLKHQAEAVNFLANNWWVLICWQSSSHMHLIVFAVARCNLQRNSVFADEAGLGETVPIVALVRPLQLVHSQSANLTVFGCVLLQLDWLYTRPKAPELGPFLIVSNTRSLVHWQASRCLHRANLAAFCSTGIPTCLNDKLILCSLLRVVARHRTVLQSGARISLQCA